jgi:hypothetical protein
MLGLLTTGMYFNLPDQFRWLVERFSTLTPEVEAKTSLEPNHKGYPIQSALTLAQILYLSSKAQ